MYNNTTKCYYFVCGTIAVALKKLVASLAPTEH